MFFISSIQKKTFVLIDYSGPDITKFSLQKNNVYRVFMIINKIPMIVHILTIFGQGNLFFRHVKKDRIKSFDRVTHKAQKI